MPRFKLPSGQVVQFDQFFEFERAVTIPELTEMIEDQIVVVRPAATEMQTFAVRPVDLTPDERTAAGLTEIVEDQTVHDTRYGFVNEDPENPGHTIFTPYPADMLKERLIAYAKDKRWQKEVGGIVVAGVPIATDDRSKQMIMGARIAAEADPEFTAEWDAADGQTPVTLSAVQIVAVSNAVLAHVAAVFTAYKTLNAGVLDGSIVTFEAIDAAFASD